MKPSTYQRYPHRSIAQDAFILLTPITLTFVGILWFFREDWLPQRVVLIVVAFSSRLHDLWTTGA
jgi:hypothetical protein